MNIHFLRHATSIITINGLTLLVDPMLSEAGAMDPVANAGNQKRIPLIDLPMSERELKQLLQDIDAVLVTHTHRDHWDARAIELLPKDLPILCQPEDEQSIKQAGFSSVTPIASQYSWQGVEIQRTRGQHGTGEIGQKMGPVSGFFLQAEGEPSLYIAGDTVWCPEVQSALATFSPEAVMLNAGAAEFLVGGPITMTAEDVSRVCRAAPTARVIAVHFETVNHCRLTRAALKQHLEEEGLADQVQIPADGAVINLAHTKD